MIPNLDLSPARPMNLGPLLGSLFGSRIGLTLTVANVNTLGGTGRISSTRPRERNQRDQASRVVMVPREKGGTMRQGRVREILRGPLPLAYYTRWGREGTI